MHQWLKNKKFRIGLIVLSCIMFSLVLRRLTGAKEWWLLVDVAASYTALFIGFGSMRYFSAMENRAPTQAGEVLFDPGYTQGLLEGLLNDASNKYGGSYAKIVRYVTKRVLEQLHVQDQVLKTNEVQIKQHMLRISGAKSELSYLERKYPQFVSPATALLLPLEIRDRRAKLKDEIKGREDRVKRLEWFRSFWLEKDRDAA